MRIQNPISASPRWASLGPRRGYLSIRGVDRGDAEVEPHDLPRAALVEDDVVQAQVAVHHLHPAVEEGQAL